LSGLFTVYRWELRKLLAQKRVYLGIGAGVIYALAFVIVLSLKTGGVPSDVPLGAAIRSTGLALPLVLLSFAAVFGAPLVTVIVAGDILSGEDQNDTMKTILTRSIGRTPIFYAKALVAATYTVFVIFLTGLVAVVGASIAWGFKPLAVLSGGFGLSEQSFTAFHALGLVAASYALYLMPLLTIAAFAVFLSAVTHNSTAALVGALFLPIVMQLIAAIPGIGNVRHYLLSYQFEAWHTLFRASVNWTIIGRSIGICALYATVFLLAGWWIFRRRDVAGT
jgi:ABC-2 type transport system permease protein